MTDDRYQSDVNTLPQANSYTLHHHHHHHRSILDKAPLTGAQRRRTDIK